MRKAKSKKQPTHKLIKEILHPKEILNVDFNLSKLQAFYKFSIEYKHENFEDVIRVVLGDDTITSNLNAFCTSPEGLMSKPAFENSQISIDKLLLIYKWLIIHNKEQIIQFESSQEKIEEWCLLGDVESIESEIELIYSLYGDSFWMINMRLLVAYLKDDRDFLENAHRKYKNNESYILKDIVARKSWLFQLHDTTTYVENITTRTIGELKDGLATDYAAIYALSLTKYPLYDEVKTFHSVYELQKFPLIDIYMFLCESLSQSIKSEIVVNDKNVDDLKCGIPAMFFELADAADLKRLNRILSIIDDKFISPEFDDADDDIKYYVEGNYKLIIDNFESNFHDVNYKISKVNILAKSYIKENRLPKSTIPSIIYDV
ncbi:hypothetical protein L4D00_23245, partial [Photobacterium swingsii]|uniref:hypothetical protein n=1 Tax=Photobacterium swingsii TaxID=680026 RepID=UPI003D12CEE2